MTTQDPPADKRKISPEALERLRTTVVELFSQGLFHQVGIRDIARQAKVGAQTIYKYFGNKEALIYACIKPELEGLSQQLEDAASQTQGQPTRQRLEAFGRHYVGFYLNHRAIAEIVFVNVPMRNWIAEPGFVQHRQLGLLGQLLREGQEAGMVRQDASVELLVTLLAGATNRYLVRLLEIGPKDLDPDAEATELFRLLWPLVAAQS